jgi:magnesium chelatase family protein
MRSAESPRHGIAGQPVPLRAECASIAPADIRKEGACFDLPIALGILATTGALNGSPDAPFAVVGELALEAQIQAVRAVLAVSLACQRHRVGTTLCL